MVTETDTETKHEKAAWLEIQSDEAAPDLGDLAAWLATAAAAWTPGTGAVRVRMNSGDIRRCALPEMQDPLTVHGRARMKFTSAS